MAGLQLSGVRVVLGGEKILENFNLEVAQGECLALLGPSGCGKTTTLRTIAGFIQPQQGEVIIAGRKVAGLEPNQRNVGLVFQDYALFPHMTLAENIGYGLRMRHVSKAETAERVRDALAMVQLSHAGDRLPAELSGGQRQRIALARALVIRPDVLLLDEPLGALDRSLRDRMQIELKQLQKRLGITTIIVTHDQEEALSLADRVAVMFNGRIEEMATPQDIYEGPRSRKVMEFLGSANVLPVQVADTSPAGAIVEGAGGLRVHLPGCSLATGWQGDLALRPEHFEVHLERGQPEDVPVTLQERVYKGCMLELHAVSADGVAIQASTVDPLVKATVAGRPNGPVYLRPRPAFVQLYNNDGVRVH